MNPNDASQQGENIPVDFDVLGADGEPLILYVVSCAHAMDAVSNADLRRMGILNFPGRELGLPD